jgi:hypothetical protein
MKETLKSRCKTISEINTKLNDIASSISALGEKLSEERLILKLLR